MKSIADKVEPPWLTYKTYLTGIYGEPLFRVPLDPGWGCPNRDKHGHGGCTFCAEDGSRAQQTRGADRLEDQVRQAVAFARERYRAKKLAAYLQAYTATYSSTQKLENLCRQLTDTGLFTALILGTRPDCLSKRTLEMLEQLNREIDVWVELGVQTTHDETLIRIKRQHDWACSREAIFKLDALNLRPSAHLIVGLPGEEQEHYVQTAERLAETPIGGVKFHNLHVIKGTALAAEYRARPFPVLDEHEYAEALIEMIRRMPPGIPLMRLQADTPPARLIAPKWEMKKGQFMGYLARQMTSRKCRQGDRYRATLSAAAPQL